MGLFLGTNSLTASGGGGSPANTYASFFIRGQLLGKLSFANIGATAFTWPTSYVTGRVTVTEGLTSVEFYNLVNPGIIGSDKVTLWNTQNGTSCDFVMTVTSQSGSPNFIVNNATFVKVTASDVFIGPADGMYFFTTTDSDDEDNITPNLTRSTGVLTIPSGDYIQTGFQAARTLEWPNATATGSTVPPAIRYPPAAVPGTLGQRTPDVYRAEAAVNKLYKATETADGTAFDRLSWSDNFTNATVQLQKLNSCGNQVSSSTTDTTKQLFAVKEVLNYNSATPTLSSTETHCYAPLTFTARGTAATKISMLDWGIVRGRIVALCLATVNATNTNAADTIFAADVGGNLAIISWAIGTSGVGRVDATVPMARTGANAVQYGVSLTTATVGAGFQFDTLMINHHTGRCYFDFQTHIGSSTGRWGGGIVNYDTSGSATFDETNTTINTGQNSSVNTSLSGASGQVIQMRGITSYNNKWISMRYGNDRVNTSNQLITFGSSTASPTARNQYNNIFGGNQWRADSSDTTNGLNGTLLGTSQFFGQIGGNISTNFGTAQNAVLVNDDIAYYASEEWTLRVPFEPIDLVGDTTIRRVENADGTTDRLTGINGNLKQTVFYKVS